MKPCVTTRGDKVVLFGDRLGYGMTPEEVRALVVDLVDAMCVVLSDPTGRLRTRFPPNDQFLNSGNIMPTKTKEE